MKNKFKKKGREWRRVSLVIAGKSLDPEKVFGALDVIPDDWGKRGDIYNKNKKYKQGFWSIWGRPSTGKLETQMKSILKIISKDKQKLEKIIKEEKTIREAYLLIDFTPPEGVANANKYFNADLINAFTSMGINIALSVQIIAEYGKL